jgi:hypothetical protein
MHSPSISESAFDMKLPGRPPSSIAEPGRHTLRRAEG